MYDYECVRCLKVFEDFTPMQQRDSDHFCKCGQPGVRLISAPNISEWKKDRRFPNLRKEGDGAMSFETRAEYKLYLAENNICELSTDAKKATKPLNKVVRKTATIANRVTPRQRVEAI